MRYIRYILLLAAVFFLAPLAVLPRRAAGACPAGYCRYFFA